MRHNEAPFIQQLNYYENFYTETNFLLAETGRFTESKCHAEVQVEILATKQASPNSWTE
jgi:hypothetical protein